MFFIFSYTEELTTISSPPICSSCTIFTAAIGNTVLFGNTEDYLLNNVYRWYLPSQSVSTNDGIKEIYGALFVGFDNNGDPGDGYAQGGVNEFGLCFDANGLPDTIMHLDPSASYPYTNHALAQVLWECKNVSEVIDWYQNHRWSPMGGQIHYADKFGGAVVVSANATGQWAFTQIGTSTYLVSTNFNLANHANGWYPCTRYTTATNILSSITSEEELTVSTCADVLYAVHQEGTYGTKYANIFDPVNLDVYFCRGNEFSWTRKYDVMYRLNNGIFEKKRVFMGVSGVDGGDIRVKTEEIQVQFPTGDVGVDTWVYVVSSIGGLIFVGAFITTIILVRKNRRKKEIEDLSD